MILVSVITPELRPLAEIMPATVTSPEVGSLYEKIASSVILPELVPLSEIMPAFVIAPELRPLA